AIWKSLRRLILPNRDTDVVRRISYETRHTLLGRSHLISGQHRVRIEAPGVSIHAGGDVVPVIITPSPGQVKGIELSGRQLVSGVIRGDPELRSKLALSKSGNFSTRNHHFIGAAGSTSTAQTHGRVRNKPWLGAWRSRRIFRRLGNSLRSDACGFDPKSPGKVRILSGLHVHGDAPIGRIG